MSESRSKLITCGLIFLEIKRRYSVFLGLADNLLATNQEKTSLMQDSIIDTAMMCIQGKMKYIFEFHMHKNDNGCQGILR